MNLFRVSTRLLTALVCVAAAGACTNPGPGDPPTTKPSTTKPPVTAPAPGPLVEYSASGGMCIDRVCGVEVTIHRDGTWQATRGTRQADGRLEPSTVGQLSARIEREIHTLADLKPAPELCPEAYDGSNLTFSFHTGTTSVTVTNCDRDNPANNREIPSTNALLLSTTRLVNSLLPNDPPPAGVSSDGR
jgi:hypothetical protein